MTLPGIVNKPYGSATLDNTPFARPAPLDAPKMQSPEDNKIIAIAYDTPLELTWKSVDRADSYVVEISEESNFNEWKTVFAKTTSTSINAKTLTTLKNKHQYYWRVRAVSGVQSSGWGNSLSFTFLVPDITQIPPSIKQVVAETTRIDPGDSAQYIPIVVKYDQLRGVNWEWNCGKTVNGVLRHENWRLSSKRKASCKFRAPARHEMSSGDLENGVTWTVSYTVSNGAGEQSGQVSITVGRFGVKQFEGSPNVRMDGDIFLDQREQCFKAQINGVTKRISIPKCSFMPHDVEDGDIWVYKNGV